MHRLVRLFAPLALACACLPVAPAAAIPFPVKSAADSGSETLRWAIEEANDRAGADSIPIEVTGTIKLQSALPSIADSITIVGPGAADLAVERDAVAAFRIFEFGVGATASVSDLTVRNGLATTGAGILALGNLTLTRVVVTGNEAANNGGGVNFVSGGGILSAGSLALRETFVHDNTVSAGGGSVENLASGGGIEVEGPLTVERSTISGNSVFASGGGGTNTSAEGGGLYLIDGPVTIEQSTISGNSVLAADGPSTNVARGGGVAGAGVALTGTTVAGNSAAAQAAGAIAEFADGANLATAADSSVRNSIVSDPRGDAESCAVALPSGGFNIDEDGSCEFAQQTDLSGVDPGLDPDLEFNGGPTPTHALLESSLAIDRGNSFGSSFDQRGLTRPVDLATRSNTEGGDGSDIGAFELQAPPTPTGGPTLVSEVPADRTPPNTRIVSGPPRVTYKRLAKFRFASTEPQSSFQCKLDKRPWRGCATPFKRKVGAGAKHIFKVRAIDRFGNVDPSPARFGWRVKPLS